MKNYINILISACLLFTTILIPCKILASDFITPVNALEEAPILDSSDSNSKVDTTNIDTILPSSDSQARVEYFINTNPHQQLVIISKGSNQGVVEQNLFRSYRNLGDTKIPTGTLKAIEVHPDYSVALVLEDNLSPLSTLGNYTTIMASDLIEDYQRQIVKKQILSKIIELPYKKLFQEYDVDALSMNLSPDGKNLLRKEIQELLSNNVSKILIESHSGNLGSFRSNQLESEERAKSIKYFLEYEFGIDEDRIVAIGLGKSSPKTSADTINSEYINRRIVIKAID